MHKFNLELQGVYSFPLTYFGNEYTKKELKGEDYLKLYGALSIMCLHNLELLEEYGMAMQNIIDDAAIQSDELYLNNFEGYDVTERLNLKSLYLNENDCVIASVYDKKLDRFIDFVM